jgi:eukaryotic-like serine/threonine-protein kinase
MSDTPIEGLTGPNPTVLRELARTPAAAAASLLGRRLGPYEILGRLGAGGMGEVYRARDTRLHREVALKVIRATSTLSDDLLRRFEAEGRAAGALHHPNILAIYDTGSVEDVPFIVFELLEGETLDRRLAREPMSVQQAVGLAQQLARGLVAAHARGIIHRDLKPANVFVTRDREVKILDFGLAKVLPTETGSPSSSSVMATDEGVVLGTAGYMAPEQVRGQAVDHRADIFSFGAILYEMLAGRPAFAAPTTADRMAAVLREEPAELRGSTPERLWRLVRRCLEKVPEERIQSTKDLLFHLEALSDVHPWRETDARRRQWRRLSRIGIGGMFAILAAAAAMMFATVYRATLDRGRTGQALDLHRISFQNGRVTSARFAPDGQTIVYASAFNGRPLEILTSRLGSPESRLLGVAAGAELLAMSASGELALQMAPRRRDRSDARLHGTLARVALGGGVPRQVVEGVQAADWGAGGTTLAVVREAEGKSRLEYPVGQVIYSSEGWISHPRVSPDGKLVAFLEHPQTGDDGGAVALVDQEGKKRLLAQGFVTAWGLAWAPEGDEVWFTASRAWSLRALYAVDLAGRDRMVYQALAALTLHDIDRDGGVLLTQEVVRWSLMARVPDEPGERDFGWLDGSDVGDLSPDGRTLVLSEVREGGGPRYSTYLRATDGSPTVRLGDGDAWGISPDGKWVLSIPFARPGSVRTLMLLPTGAGEPRVLSDGKMDHVSASWFRDGKRLLIAASEAGAATRLYVRELGRGRPQPITPAGVWHEATVSPDGELVATIGPDGLVTLFPVVPGPPRPVPGAEPGDLPAQFSSNGRFLYLFRRGEWPAPVYRVDLTTGRKEVVVNIRPAEPGGSSGIIGRFRITPDGQWYAYSYDRSITELFLVRGLN